MGKFAFGVDVGVWVGSGVGGGAFVASGATGATVCVIDALAPQAHSNADAIVK